MKHILFETSVYKRKHRISQTHPHPQQNRVKHICFTPTTKSCQTHMSHTHNKIVSNTYVSHPQQNCVKHICLTPTTKLCQTHMSHTHKKLYQTHICLTPTPTTKLCHRLCNVHQQPVKPTSSVIPLFKPSCLPCVLFFCVGCCFLASQHNPACYIPEVGI